VCKKKKNDDDGEFLEKKKREIYVWGDRLVYTLAHTHSNTHTFSLGVNDFFEKISKVEGIDNILMN
jgi:hypothetical protein